MTKKKILQKITVLFLFSLLLLSSFVPSAFAISSRYDCSYVNYSCKGVKVTGYGTSVAYSDYVYAIRGQILAVSNNSTGPFNLVTELVNSSGKVVSSTVTYTDTIFIRIGIAGNYRVKVTCKDGSVSKRCTGGGMVSQ